METLDLQQEQIFTVHAAARILKMSVGSIRQLAKEGALQSLKRKENAMWRFTRGHLTQFILDEEHAVSTGCKAERW